MGGWHAFNRRVVAGLACAALSVAAWNLVVDPWGVFQSPLLRAGASTNERWLKVAHLLKDPQRYDGFLVGSSRIGLFDPAVAAQLWPDTRWYNLGVFAGEAGDAHAMLQALHARGVCIRRVIFGIDAFAFLAPPASAGFANRHHPVVTGAHPVRAYLDYLFAPSVPDGLLKLVGATKPVPEIAFDFGRSGRYQLPRREQDRAQDPEGFAARYLTPAAPARHAYRINQDALARLSDFLDWMRAEGIEVLCFRHPRHPADVLSRVSTQTLTDLDAAIRKRTGPIADFARDGICTRGQLHWLDAEHYDAETGACILARLRLWESLLPWSPPVNPLDPHRCAPALIRDIVR